MGSVYFIRRDGDWAIKIGWATNPKRRRRELQAGSAEDLRIITTIPGTQADETAWHRRFRHLQIRREWFRQEQDLIDAIEALGEGVKVNPETSPEALAAAQIRLRHVVNKLKAGTLKPRRRVRNDCVEPGESPVAPDPWQRLTPLKPLSDTSTN